MKVRISFWIVLLLGAVSYLAGVKTSSPGNLVFLRLAYFFTGLIVVSWVWAFFSVVGLDIKRNARYVRQQVGQVFEERIEIINQSNMVRLWVEIRDKGTLPGARTSKVISMLGRKQRRSYIARTLLLDRGEFNLGPTVVSSGDPFGLFTFSRSIPNEKTLLVMPHWVQVDQFAGLPGLLPGGRALRRRSLEVSPHAAGVREYAPGDPLSRIHWKTTARRDRLMVKEFEQDPQADVWILLDANRVSNFAQKKIDQRAVQDQFFVWMRKYELKLPVDTFEYSICAAASLANYYIQQGRAVGLGCVGLTYVALAAERGERQLSKIFETLALIKCEGELSLLGLVESQGHISRGSTVVVVSAAGGEIIELSISLLQRRDLRPVAVLIDQKSFGGWTDGVKVAADLKSRGIPTTLIQKDDDLTRALIKPE